MERTPDRPVTQLLSQWRSGNERALGELTGLVYQELRNLAQRHLRKERPNHTIQRTALVHEAFVRLVNQQSVDWQSRAHFFALAARLMRQILVDHARARGYRKRGGGRRQVSFDEALVCGALDWNLVELDEALQALSAMDIRKGRVVEMRFFGGLSAEETATVLQVSPQTVLRDWKLSKAWLLQRMSRGRRAGASTPAES
jgi:RNA polymerase sigma-70 factor (ECF subfamily)